MEAEHVCEEALYWACEANAPLPTPLVEPCAWLGLAACGTRGGTVGIAACAKKRAVVGLAIGGALL